MPTVTFTPNNTELELDYGSELTELENLENNRLPFGCRSAACGKCVIKVEKGSENLTPINQNEIDLLEGLDFDITNHRLACQCQLQGDITIEPLNQ